MNELAPTAPLIVNPEQLHPIRQLYDQGLYFQAYGLASQIGPLHHWRGTDARILAGRLAGNLGTLRMGDWHYLHAWRKDKQHAEAHWYYARTLMAIRGPWAAWQFVQKHPLPANATKTSQSHWCSQQGAILSLLRDFDAAEDWLKKADEFGPQPWTCVEWAAAYLFQDRVEEAETAARRALELHPWYRPAVQWVAHFLVQKERDAEALDLLTQATTRLESGSVCAQLAILEIELKQFDAAGKHLDDFERLSPLLDDWQRQWLDARRCDLACLKGERELALEKAQAILANLEQRKGISAVDRRKGEKALKQQRRYYENLIQRLRDANPGKRVEMPVGFVRQHHKTCAPATLTSIAKFWQMPAEHVEVADEISYSGTPHHNERRWADEHGWHTKAFTVTWDAAVALLDRGIAFTLATTEVSSAHLQAVIGYDATKGTLIIRDPGERHRVEMNFDIAAERYRSTGPRGMAMVPAAQKEKLEGLKLPDEELHNLVYKFDLALDGHRRAEAGEIAKALAAKAPDHYLTLFARRTLAIYDADPPAGLIATEQLLRMFPDDMFLQLARADYLRTLGKREQRLEILKRLSEQKETDPACWQLYAEELASDPRRDPETLYLLRRAMRLTPPQSPLLGRLFDLLARIRMDQRKFGEALELHHFAVCLEDRDEIIAQNLFYTARARGEAERALELLQKRFKRFGAKSSQPARTLYSALMQMEKYSEAFEVLDRAMKLRPKDGDLLTYAADAHTHRGEFDEAENILKKADGISKPAARLRSQAYLAINRDQRSAARDLYAEVVKIEPLAEDAHRWYVQLVAEKEERAAALKYLGDVCKRFPHHFGLARLQYDWLLEDGPVARELSIKKLIEIHPANAWARTEYAYNLSDQDRLEDAHRQLDEAEPMDPDGPGVWFARGILYKKTFRTEDAMFAFREAIRHSVDFEAAIQELLWQCENLQDRRDAVAFIVSELLRQATFGGGILALCNTAQLSFPPEELLAALRRIHDARSDLWQSWSAVNRQLLFVERYDEALAWAQKAVQRFPALSGLWLDVAESHRAMKNLEGERIALERATELAPNMNTAIARLADVRERTEKIDDAKKTFEQAIRRAPLLPATYMDYAELLYRTGARDEAIQQAKRALKLDPWYENAWNRLCAWLMQLDRMDEGIELARGWTRERPGDTKSWVRLGQAHQWQTPRAKQDDEDERVNASAAAYDEALKRHRYGRDICDMKAEMLGFAARHDDARRACTPSAFKGKIPIELRGRAAWIKAQEQDYDAAKQQMAALLKEERTYLWGWNQIVDWSFATHQFREYHDAANEWLKARPQSATALTYRGEARVRMDERDTGLEDLKNANRKDPCNTLAAFTLFDEQMADDDTTGAETTLLSIQINVTGDFVKARQVQFHGKRENQSEALGIFRRMTSVAWTQAQPLDMAMRALDLAGWKKQAEEILREEMKQPHWNLHLAPMFAAHWNPNVANDLPDRIAALDEALKRQPETFYYLDLKAELLASGNQFERAWQVCKEKTFPQDQFALDGRAAWVMYRSGRVDEAIETMSDLVQKHPKYFWGWSQLADWHGRAQRWVDVLTAAEQLVVLKPRDPLGYGYRGWAKEFLNDLDAARTDYVHALDVQPSYVWGAWQLFNLYVRKGEWQRAEKILDKAKKHADKGEWALRKVDLLVYQNRKAGFPAEFENLCKNAEKNPMVLEQSLQFLVQAGWWADAEEVLHRSLDLGAHICDPWVRLRVQMGDRKVASDIRLMSERRTERTNCIAAYAIELAYTKDARGLRKWILDFEEDLRGDTKCWAKVGAALAVVQDWDGLIEWMSDWKEHEKATPGQVLPLMKALRSKGDLDEAREVSKHAQAKLTPDYASSFHKVWLMYDQAMDGDMTQVQRYLESSDLGGFDGYHQMIAAMVRAVWLVTTDKENGFTRARQVLADAGKWAPPTVHDPALTAAYQQSVSYMAEKRGTFGAKLWRWWRWLVPTLPKVQPGM